MIRRVIAIIKAHKILTVVVILILIVVVFSLRKRTSSINVDTYTVSNQEIVKTITASGMTTPKTDNVARSGVTAKVNEIYFESGTQVSKGDVVLKLDQTSLGANASAAWKSYLDAKAALDSLDAQIKAAETDLSEKKQVRDKLWRDYMGDNGEDKKQLYKSAESNYQDSVAALTVLKDKKSAVSQGVTSTYATYAVTAESLQSGTVKAPASGTLVLENIYNGASVVVGQVLFSITNFEGTEFTAEIDETDVQYIKEGLPVVITLEGYSDETQNFAGTVARIDGKTQITTSGSTIIPTTIKFISGPSVTLILNMSGTATIEVARNSNAPAIPFDAILFDSDDKSYVFVVNGDKVEKREVQLGFEGTDYIAIDNGANIGDVIVVGDAVSRLSDGSKISVIKD